MKAAQIFRSCIVGWTTSKLMTGNMLRNKMRMQWAARAGEAWAFYYYILRGTVGRRRTFSDQE